MAKQHQTVVTPKQPAIKNKRRHTKRAQCCRFAHNMLALRLSSQVVERVCECATVQPGLNGTLDALGAIHSHDIVGEHRSEQRPRVGPGGVKPPCRRASHREQVGVERNAATRLAETYTIEVGSSLSVPTPVSPVILTSAVLP